MQKVNKLTREKVKRTICKSLKHKFPDRRTLTRH